jgi:hypothetical protein
VGPLLSLPWFDFSVAFNSSVKPLLSQMYRLPNWLKQLV